MNWLKRFIKGVANLFSKLDSKTKKVLPVAVRVTEAVKKFMDSPYDDMVIRGLQLIIPGKYDDIVISKAFAAVEAVLPQLILKLKYMESIALSTMSPEAKAIEVIKSIKFSSDEEKNCFAHNLSSLIIQYLSDGKLTIGECFKLSEFIYEEWKKNEKADV